MNDASSGTDCMELHAVWEWALLLWVNLRLQLRTDIRTNIRTNDHTYVWTHGPYSLSYRTSSLTNLLPKRYDKQCSEKPCFDLRATTIQNKKYLQPFSVIELIPNGGQPWIHFFPSDRQKNTVEPRNSGPKSSGKSHNSRFWFSPLTLFSFSLYVGNNRFWQ